MSLVERKLRLPTGREAAIVEGLKFCYDLSETDAVILFELLRGEEYTVDDLTGKLGLSKATVNRGLTKLVELGFVSRRREKRSTVGRPRYVYYVKDPRKVIERMIEDFVQCSKAFQEALESLAKDLSHPRQEQG